LTVDTENNSQQETTEANNNIHFGSTANRGNVNYFLGRSDDTIRALVSFAIVTIGRFFLAFAKTTMTNYSKKGKEKERKMDR